MSRARWESPGEDGLSGGGGGASGDPAVAADIGLGKVVEGGGALGQFLQAGVDGSICGSARGQDEQVARLIAGEELSGFLGPQGANHAGAPDFGLENAHEDVAHLVHDHAVPGLPGLGLDAGDGVLDGQRVGDVDEGVDAGGVGLEDHAGVVVHGVAVRLGAGGEPGSGA